MRSVLRQVPFILSLASGAVDARIHVAIFDGPIQYDQTALHAKVDFDTLTSLGWLERNEKFREKAQERVEKAWASLSEMYHSGCAELLSVLKLGDLYSYSAHGTTSALLLVRGLTSAKLINMSYMTSGPEKWKPLSLRELLGTKTSKLRSAYTAQTEPVSKALQDFRPKVVSISLTTSEKYIFEKRLDSASLLHRTVGRAFLKRHAAQEASELFFAMQKMMRENPNSIFVLAAGNDGKNLEDFRFNFANLSEPNLIKVGAIEENESLWRHSNFSPKFVDIGAWGVDVPVPFDGETKKATGTSVSAPLVANRIARLAESHPELGPEALIDLFYRTEANSIDALRPYFRDGKILSPSLFHD